MVSCMSEMTYTVTGMTCEHCVRAVETEVAGLAGVTGVEVSLDAGEVRVTGDGIDDAAVRAAVAEAGYAVVDTGG
jgi:copper chaperone CopZ